VHDRPDGVALEQLAHDIVLPEIADLNRRVAVRAGVYGEHFASGAAQPRTQARADLAAGAGYEDQGLG